MIFVIAMFVINSLFAVTDVRPDKQHTVVVLGNNNMAISKKRVRCAVEVIGGLNVRKIIFSGKGSGFVVMNKADKKIRIYESEYMNMFFREEYPNIKNSVNVYIENNSMNTHDNIKFSLKYLSPVENIVIVSTHPEKRLKNACRRLARWLKEVGEISYCDCQKYDGKVKRIIYRRKKDE